MPVLDQEYAFADLKGCEERNMGTSGGSAIHCTSEDPKGEDQGFVKRLPIPVDKGMGTLFLKVDDILWISAESQYVRLHTRKKSYLVRMASMTLNNLSRVMDPRRFQKVHRSYIVNLDQVHSLYKDGKEKWFLELATGNHIPVSRPHLTQLKERLVGFKWC